MTKLTYDWRQDSRGDITLTRSDGADLFLQGDSAAAFMDRGPRRHGVMRDYSDLIAEYFDNCAGLVQTAAEVIGTPRQQREARRLEQARAEYPGRVIVEVQGGVVQAVHGLPENLDWTIVDHDDLDDETDA